MTAAGCCPETILFAVDLDAEAGQQVAQNRSRLDVIKHAISNVVHAKRWACAAHRFGLITVQQDTCSLHPLGATSSAERFLEALNLLSSPPAAAAEQQQGCPDSSSSSSRPFDLGSLIAAVQPLQQQQQGQLLQAPSRSAAAQQVHGGVLMPLSGNANSTSSSSAEPQQHLLRVVLVYCRSRLPAPVWVSHRHGPGLAVDCLHVHDKPQPGEQQQQLQKVYSDVEALVDKMSLQAGHSALIYETTGKNLAKLLSCMSVMMSHPQQRPPQALAKPPVDLALADLQPLPSDAANLASGVPIMSPAQLPAGGAWARPLSAGTAVAAAAAGGSSTPDRGAAGTAAAPSWLGPSSSSQPPGGSDPWASAAGAQSSTWDQRSAVGTALGAAEDVVTGVPADVVAGVPDAETPLIGFDLAEGVVVGIDASRTGSLNLDAVDTAGSRRSSLQAVPPVDAEIAELARSLGASDMSAYPKIG